MKTSDLLAIDDAAIDTMDIEQLRMLLKILLKGYKELYAQVHGNEKNTNIPSSQQIYQKPQSTREKTGKKPGGQDGHTGSKLELHENPDTRIYVRNITKGHKKMQVIDIVAPRITCTEYCATVGITSEDLMCIDAKDLPVYIKGSIQYGPQLRAYVLYLRNHMMNSYEKIAELLFDFYGLKISVGTLVGFDVSFARSLAPRYLATKQYAKEQFLLHVDETGVRVDGKNGWVHTICNEAMSLFHYDAKRGGEAIANMGVLSTYTGVMVHDFRKSYFDCTQATHAMCGAHLLRELQRVIDYESEGKQRATSMKRTLLELKHTQETGAPIQDLLAMYQAVCRDGMKAYPAAVRTGTRGKIKQMKGKNLLDRFVAYQEAILRFTQDPNVPFTNNCAERDLRMNKVKMKISGCFRSSSMAQYFAIIRSFFETVRKQGISLSSSIYQYILDPSPSFGFI